MNSIVDRKTAWLFLGLSLFFGGWMDIDAVSAQRSRLLFEHPFIIAARSGELLAVREHIARGDTVEVRDIAGQTPLMIAAVAGDLDIVDAIVAATDKIDTKDNQGNTALALAAIHDQPEIVKTLLDAGSSPNVQNRQGMTPLMLAAMKSRLIQVELMLQRAPNFTLRDYTGRNLMAWARQSRDKRILLLFEKLGLGD
jgi:ankyrin repeat protein